MGIVAAKRADKAVFFRQSVYRLASVGSCISGHESICVTCNKQKRLAITTANIHKTNLVSGGGWWI
jgi:hypothetical protein